MHTDFVRFCGTRSQLAQHGGLPNPVALRDSQKLRFRHQTQDLYDAPSEDCKRAGVKAGDGCDRSPKVCRAGQAGPLNDPLGRDLGL